MLSVRRNGVVLRQQPLKARQLADAPLTLRARREQDMLTMEVLQEGAPIGSLRFQDVFAAGSSESGVFCFRPGGAELQSLHLRRQTLPPVAGPLEEADHLLAQGEVRGSGQISESGKR